MPSPLAARRNDDDRRRDNVVIRAPGHARISCMDNAMKSDQTASVMPLRVLGAGLLFATAGIHLDLYLTGYHSIPTIGTLFLLQVISAFVLGLTVLARDSFLINASASGFLASTIGGYLLSRAVGLFGFKEVATTAGLAAGLIEVAGLVVLGVVAIKELPTGADGSRARSLSIPTIPERPARGALALIGVAALVLTIIAGVGSTKTPTSTTATASSAPASAASTAVASVKVTISNFTFVPANLTVSPGEKIIVTNKDSVAHTFTAVPGSTPLGNFDSGNLSPGQSATVIAPTKPGKYDYYCAIHNFMTGVLTVS